MKRVKLYTLIICLAALGSLAIHKNAYAAKKNCYTIVLLGIQGDTVASPERNHGTLSFPRNTNCRNLAKDHWGEMWESASFWREFDDYCIAHSNLDFVLVGGYWDRSRDDARNWKYMYTGNNPVWYPCPP